MLLEQTTPEAYPEIVDRLSGAPDQFSRVGDTREQLGVTVHSPNPRRRMLFRPKFNLAFALQERLAYWQGQNPGHVQRYNSNMENYMVDGELPGSGYGTRLRHVPHDQIERTIENLRENPDSRRQVINIHQAGVEDYSGPDVACTIYLQPFIRDEKLHLFVDLRSQDMLWGYCYDTQAFQWIQEVMAAILDVGLGEYWHRMNSCHYYMDVEDQVLDSARQYEYDTVPESHCITEDPTQALRVLDSRLADARDGLMPRARDLPQPFRDWLLVMTAYEQHRFHDGDDVHQVAEQIERNSWRQWTLATRS